MNEIDYEALTDNYKHMINTLEYDSMRSAGKAKMNSIHLVAMYELLNLLAPRVAAADRKRYLAENLAAKNAADGAKKETSTPKVTKPSVKNKG